MKFDEASVDADLELTQKMFKQLQIGEVRVLKNKSKDEIIEEFIYLKEESAKFNSEAKQKGALAIVIRWIGWDIDLERERR